MSTALIARLTPSEVVSTLLTVCASLTPAPALEVVLLDWKLREVKESYSLGRLRTESGQPGLCKGQRFDPDHPAIQVAQTGQARQDLAGSRQLESIWLPLPCHPQSPGVLGLHFSGTQATLPDAKVWTEDEQLWWHAVTSMTGLALNRALDYAALAERTEQLEESNAELRGYTHALSHNLGEPIERVSNFLKLAERRLGSQLDSKTRRLFELGRREAEQLAGRVMELRALALVERQSMRVTPIDLNVLLVQVRRILEPLTRGRRIHWLIDDLPRVKGDALLLWQVFVELLAFVLEDTWEQPDTQIGIDAQVPDGFVVLRLWDNGRGFPAAIGERLFEVFDRSVPRQSEFGRLGLSNVRRVVGRHGGRIRVESVEGQGVTFFVTLPRAGD
ncbi:ATP-binding protein [Deinococcus oregonensis]|uniref:histidine kinase n=1 Tax=Deinococcus oregonensis TaxID=1805970 RepID=A0ABV6AU50_9DEIO